MVTSKLGNLRAAMLAAWRRTRTQNNRWYKLNKAITKVRIKGERVANGFKRRIDAASMKAARSKAAVSKLRAKAERAASATRHRIASATRRANAVDTAFHRSAKVWGRAALAYQNARLSKVVRQISKLKSAGKMSKKQLDKLATLNAKFDKISTLVHDARGWATEKIRKPW